MKKILLLVAMVVITTCAEAQTAKPGTPHIPDCKMAAVFPHERDGLYIFIESQPVSLYDSLGI